MRFAYHATMCDPSFYLPLAKAAEEVGFDSFTLPDSICYPENSDSEYPYNDDGSREFLEDVPFLDPFTLVPAMAAVTSTIQFTTSVMKLPIRQPVIVAKQLTSVAVISGGRFRFGVGLSPWPDDYAACQIPWERRGKRMDEMMEILTGLMSGQYFSYQGEIFQIDSMKLCPVPSQPVPLLIGGHSKPALRRAARLADGFMHAGGDLEEVSHTNKQIDEFRREFERDHLPFEYQCMGSEAFTLEGIQRLEDVGIDEVIVAFRNPYDAEPDTDTLEDKIGQLHWYAENIIRPARGAGA